jgi:anti-anti-sigma factor
MLAGDGPIYLSRECSLTSERQGDSLLVRIQGEFDLACDDRFKEEMGRLVDQKTARLVLDLRELSFIDSTGLRALVRLDSTAKSDGFDFTVLYDPSGPIRRVLEVAGMEDVLPLADGSAQ